MWSNPQETKGLVTFTEEILNERLQFLGSVTDAEVYSEPCQTSKLNHFAKIVNG